MDIKQCMLVNNNCYKQNKKIKPTGIMVHSTGANNPNLKRYVQPDDGLLGVNGNGNHWNQPKPSGLSVCVHAFIGKDKNGDIRTYQTLPWNIRAWHAGGSANNNYIGFEICEDGLTDVKYFNAVYKEAVDLCVYLCKEYNIKPSNIITHSEGYKKRIASNHGDVMHWFPRHGKSMDTFRADVEKLLKKPEVIKDGWFKKDEKWHYNKSSLLLKKEWLKHKGYWYYFNKNGELHTGWVEYKNDWYYCDTDKSDAKIGKMLTSTWIKDDGKWYYVDKDGKMLTGWLELKGKKYYLNPNSGDPKGSMVSNGFKLIDGKKYGFNKDGECTNYK